MAANRVLYRHREDFQSSKKINRNRSKLSAKLVSDTDLKKRCYNQYMRHSIPPDSLVVEQTNESICSDHWFSSESGFSCVKKFKCQFAQNIVCHRIFKSMWWGWAHGQMAMNGAWESVRYKCFGSDIEMVYLLTMMIAIIWWNTSSSLCVIRYRFDLHNNSRMFTRNTFAIKAQPLFAEL